MSQIFDNAKKGYPYCLTAKTVPCTVTTKGENGLIYTLVTADKPGQYNFVSPYYQLLISQDDAICTEIDQENLEISNIQNITNINGKTDNSLPKVDVLGPSSLTTLIRANGLSKAYILTDPVSGVIDWGDILSYTIDPNKVDSLYIYFKVTNGAFPSIIWPASLKWTDATPPIIAANGDYLFVIMQTPSYAVANMAYALV